MLYLNLEAHSVKFALAAGVIEAIVSTAKLSPVSGGGPELVGLMSRALTGIIVPVFDLGIMVTGSPVQDSLGTRLVIVDLKLPNSEVAKVAIRAEGVVTLSKTLRPKDSQSGQDRYLIDEDGELYVELELTRLLSPKSLDFLSSRGKHE